MKTSLAIDFRMCRSSGIGTYISSLASQLVNTFDITLLCEGSMLNGFDFASSVRHVETKAKIYSIHEQLELFAKVPKCDVFWSPHYNVPVLPVRAKKRMVTIHDTYHLIAGSGLFSPIQRLYAKSMMGSASFLSDAVLTVSEFSKAEILKHCKVNASKIHIVHNAVDENYCVGAEKIPVHEKFNLPEKYLLFVGNIKPNKNLVTLLKAVELMDNIDLVVVGKREGFITGDSAVGRVIERSEILKRRVFFTGVVDNKDLSAIYLNASVFVFPSLYEGFGIPPLEAQRCGCPVVSSSWASLKEVCGESVLYCDPMNEEDVAEKVTFVLNSSEIRADLIKKGYANIERFSWKKSAEQIEGIIKSL